MILKAPFPWFGGKSRAAPIIWPRFGNVPNYVEPFAGSLAVLLARPHAARTETVNDADCYVANAWRAIQHAPGEVAAFADHPINEADLHARHTWLVGRAEFRERMKSEPEFFDARIAGWWMWGLSMWIGSGWCDINKQQSVKRPRLGGNAPNGVQGRSERTRPNLEPHGPNGVQRKRPVLDGASGPERGVHSRQLVKLKSADGVYRSRQLPDVYGIAQQGRGVSQQLPEVEGCDGEAPSGERLRAWFDELAARLRRVRVCCGDWSRVMGPTPLGLTSSASAGFVTAVLLDPPYSGEERAGDLYATDDHTIAEAVRAWAIEHGEDPRLRIALCGYEGEHAMPANWECCAWKTAGGYGNQAGGTNANRKRERIWFSPHCLRPELDLFAVPDAASEVPA